MVDAVLTEIREQHDDLDGDLFGSAVMTGRALDALRRVLLTDDSGGHGAR